MSAQPASDTRFHGVWIGETQGIDMPAHLWEIRQSGRNLQIATRWEGGPPATGISFVGWVVEGEPAFQINSIRATLVDPQHFIIPEWDTNDTRNRVGPSYDVVFSRPGIAELTAQRVWREWRAARDA
jgi:hypothetical protein